MQSTYVFMHPEFMNLVCMDGCMCPVCMYVCINVVSMYVCMTIEIIIMRIINDDKMRGLLVATSPLFSSFFIIFTSHQSYDKS